MADIPMKLYVWESVLQDWSSGFVAVYAPDEMAAWELLKTSDPTAYRVIQGEDARHKTPRLVEEPEAFIIWGGA